MARFALVQRITFLACLFSLLLFAPRAHAQAASTALGGCFNPFVNPNDIAVPANVGDYVRFKAGNEVRDCLCGNDVSAVVTLTGLDAYEGVQASLVSDPTHPDRRLFRYVDLKVLPQGPQDIEFNICVQAFRAVGSPCGAWTSEWVCTQRRIRVNQPRVNGSISATPSDLYVAPGRLGTTTLSWSTTVATTAQVSVKLKNSTTPATVLSTALTGSRAYSQLAPNNTYVFQLHANGLLVAHREVIVREGASGTLTATPNPVSAPLGGQGSTTLRWTSRNANDTQILVSVDGQGSTLVFSGKSGAQTVPWIVAGRSYVFTQILTGEPFNVLASVTVRGEVARPLQPLTGPWYNPARSGQGWDLQRLGTDGVSLTWFTYTASGQPIWYLSTLSGETGEWVGPLTESTWTGSTATLRNVGTAKLLVTNNQWRFKWTLGALSGEEPIVRTEFGGGATTMNLNGLWYRPEEPGWGVLFATRGTTQVATVCAFAGSRPVWLHGSVVSASTSLSVPLNYLTSTTLCPGCTGSPSTNIQSAGTLTVNGISGVPGSLTATSQLSYPGGSWNRSNVSLFRLVGP
ncbi:hypothetical protein OV208_18135 [Corallococcus sp. bb12-1]|uniref:hypothetical protein n=1 Tax=Corallococcus sp. bb12-1 TaxID=2996784 RepID=UPI00227202F6|nr:hypothetical protein [Corallococcus sp. bb12-1]MCY1043242.1 hypothetical protein [Corallococcus sp. bb12-1]